MACILTAVVAVAQEVPRGTNINPDAKMVADFKKRVADYLELRKASMTGLPPLKKTPEPAEISQAEQMLAAQVRDARATAKRGEIFTPATEAMLRRLLAIPLKKSDSASDNRAIMKDDAPAAGEVPFKVNGAYPKDAPLSTVPPEVLSTLPELPAEDLQYRFVGRHLILYDSGPNIIVDYMLNALP